MNIMAGNRWENLDFDPPQRRQDAPASVSLPSPEAAGRGADPAGRPEPGTGQLQRAEVSDRREELPAVVRQAHGAYLLRNYQAAVDHLEPPLGREPGLTGGQRVLGLALARLAREPEAVERLREAVRQSPTDWLARASLASLLLRTPLPETRAPGDGSVVASLEEAVSLAPDAARAAVRELLGAACWRIGQELLGAGRGRVAERRFAAAGVAFTLAAEESSGARRELIPRRSAVLVGQAIALIVAGSPEAAQRLFSLTPLPKVPSAAPLCRFAAGLYELCEELARVPTEERAAAVEALRQVVLQTRLEVAFYDGRGVVNLCWWGGTA